TDSCGHAFHTVDAGETYVPVRVSRSGIAFTEYGVDPYDDPDRPAGQMIPDVWRIDWISERRALAWISDAAVVLITEDAGQTWRRRALPREPRRWLLERRGDFIWACSEEGHLLRSRDAGRSFQDLGPVLPEGCEGLSFIDERHGWAMAVEPILY